MDISSSFSENLGSASSLKPGLIFSIILRTVVVTGILLIVIKGIGNKRS